MINNYQKGKYGEELAVKYLKEKNNYKILDRNFYGIHGEIDIICLDKLSNEIVFIEVKARSTLIYGMPIEAVDDNKIKNIKNTAEIYIYNCDYYNYNLRFDVIEIFILKNKYKIKHYKNIFN